jgi:hypothetical protein
MFLAEADDGSSGAWAMYRVPKGSKIYDLLIGPDSRYLLPLCTSASNGQEIANIFGRSESHTTCQRSS